MLDIFQYGYVSLEAFTAMIQVEVWSVETLQCWCKTSILVLSTS